MNLEVEDVVNRDDLLQFRVPRHEFSKWCEYTSHEFIIRKAAAFKLRVTFVRVDSSTHFTMIFVSFRNLHPNIDLNHKMNTEISGYTDSDSLRNSAYVAETNEFTSDDGRWHQCCIFEPRVMAVTVTSQLIVPKVDMAPKKDTEPKMDIAPSANISPSILKLHEDTDFTDFELRGEDGSVHVHKAVLAASSPVLRQTLSGAWRETKEGHVDVPGISQLALQHLKGYLYLHQLPDSGLEQLLLLSSYYIMPDLEQKCVDKLANTLTAENACDLMEFAAKHKMKSLMVAVLKSVQRGAIKVSDIEKQLLRGASAD